MSERNYTRQELSKFHKLVRPFNAALMQLEHGPHDKSPTTLLRYMHTVRDVLDNMTDAISENVPRDLFTYYSTSYVEGILVEIDDFLEEDVQSTSKLKTLTGDLEHRLKELRSQVSSILSTIERLHMATSKTTSVNAVPLAVVSSMLTDIGIKHEYVEARVKSGSEYQWFKYAGQRNKNILHGNGKTLVTLEPGDAYGLRESSDGKKYRLVTKKTGLTKVFTVSDTVYNMLNHGTPARRPGNVPYKVAAADGKIKVTTKIEFLKQLDHLISDLREGSSLRDRISISDPSKTKVVNWLTKRLNNPDYFTRPLQRPGWDWVIRIEQFGKGFGDPPVFKDTFKVQLVDKKTRKPIFSEGDLESGEVELVKVQ